MELFGIVAILGMILFGCFVVWLMHSSSNH